MHAYILVAKEKGLSDREAAEELKRHNKNVNHTTIHRIYQKHLKGEDIFVPKPIAGHPCKLDSSGVHWAGLLLAQGLAATAADIQKEFFPHIHVTTIQRHLVRIGFKTYKCRRVPYLSCRHQWRRLKWARALEAWDRLCWELIAFSNESKFMVFGTCGPAHYWKKRGTSTKPSNVKQVIKHGSGNVMVWGYIMHWGVGKLHHIQGTMDLAKYIEALSTAYLGTLSKFGLRSSCLIFQHDNDPKHTSRKTLKWLIEHRIRVLPWPANSPDMNPIEHVWDYLDRMVHSRWVLPQNQNELWAALEEEWYNIPLDYIAKLYESMPN
ncbi:hypothetical protein OPQ81_011940 [Rhizoctonia solani]|nr:hypothetical protein OPQ81_011940 [Rhizoctonia solani]